MIFCGVGEEGRSLIYVMLLLVPAVLYGMGLAEGGKSRYFFFAAVIFHLATLILRGIELGALPFTEKHDNISLMAFALAIAYYRFNKDKKIKNLDITALPLIVVLLCVAAAYEPLNTIPPFQKSPWFYLHSFFYSLGYALFGIAACIGVSYLLTGDAEHELKQYKGTVMGWILFSISLVTGGIWFFTAYGTYWLWTPKELWISATWFYYGLYLHLRLVKGFKGKPAAAIGIAGFCIALFTYFGVGTIIPCPPTQF